ncbi:MAG: DUF2851 family protein [Chitinophagales bacterium]|nr:DUF2851 family protein [Chitinophagales bacterium]MDW8392746.1 DUF2851 family protein [Chitinophagales bacterium]
MTEAFLHYLWRTKIPGAVRLTTTDGRPLTILHSGQWNHDEGPDFLDARLRIGELEWAGHVEVHVRSSQWRQHGHDAHPAYGNVVLHVVYEDDAPQAIRLPVATLELRPHVSERLWQRYRQLQSSTSWVPCAFGLRSVTEPLRTAWLQRLLVERLECRMQPVAASLKENHNDWQETFYQMLAGALGAPHNTEPMRHLARTVPLKVLLRHQGMPLQMEALLFGVAGLIPARCSDPYCSALQQEFRFLKKKYAISPLQPAMWRFFRLRPASFPTIRIAQLAALLQRQPALWSQVLETQRMSQFKNILKTSAAGYWENHYRFGAASPQSSKPLGEDTIRLVLINSIIPLLFFYGKTHDHPAICNRALSFLEELPPENNAIIRRWKQHGIVALTAGDTQALLHLKQQYCNPRRCLECAWGNFFLQER